MSVTLISSGDSYTVKNGALFHAFFSSITFHCETLGWGARYPFLKRLFRGKLAADEILSAIEELQDAKKILSKIKPEEIIWDISNTQKKPDSNEGGNYQAAHLAEFFVTEEGEDLFELLEVTLENALAMRDGVQLIMD